jgi:hypothetical protein
MANITNTAGKRTSNGFGGLPLVPTNTGSRLTRVVGRIENALNKGFTEVLRAPISIAHVGSTIVSPAISDAYKWLNTNPNKPYNGSSVTNQSSNTKYKDFGKQKVQSTSKVSSIGTEQTSATINQHPDNTYSWNLPPHKWSLPVDPSSISNSVASPSSDIHTKRRGMIFTALKHPGTTSTVDPKTNKKIKDANPYFNNHYGFQFLWNPETFSQSTSVNWGVTPNQNDQTAVLTGLVTANSTIDFTLRIDRTNDFAAAKAYYRNNPGLTTQVNTTTLAGIAASSQISSAELAKYYTQGQAPSSALDFSTNINTKINDLLRRGTEADLEFLYRTINGDGYQLLGENTSNISFLKPTIVRLDLGPQKLIGMVQSVNVNHLAFTRELIPIRTDVTLSIDLRTATSFLPSNASASTTSGAAF